MLFAWIAIKFVYSAGKKKSGLHKLDSKRTAEVGEKSRNMI